MTSSDLNRRTQLELQAHAIRSRLIGAIDALDRRRRTARAIGIDLMDVAVPVALGVSLLLAFGVARRRRRATIGIHFGAPKPPSWLAEIARTAAVAAVVIGAGTLASRALPRLLQAKNDDAHRPMRALPPRSSW